MKWYYSTCVLNIAEIKIRIRAHQNIKLINGSQFEELQVSLFCQMEMHFLNQKCWWFTMISSWSYLLIRCLSLRGISPPLLAAVASVLPRWHLPVVSLSPLLIQLPVFYYWQFPLFCFVNVNHYTNLPSNCIIAPSCKIVHGKGGWGGSIYHSSNDS